jgi:hypothetical protein
VDLGVVLLLTERIESKESEGLNEVVRVSKGNDFVLEGNTQFVDAGVKTVDGNGSTAVASKDIEV